MKQMSVLTAVLVAPSLLATGPVHTVPEDLAMIFDQNAILGKKEICRWTACEGAD